MKVVYHCREPSGLTRTSSDSPELLHDPALKRDWHCEKQRVECRQVQPFAGYLVDCDQHEWFFRRNEFSESAANASSFDRRKPAVQRQHWHLDSLCELAHERLKMIDSIGQNEAASLLSHRIGDLSHNEPVTSLVTNQLGVDRLD